jgi:hypothetical protein
MLLVIPRLDIRDSLVDYGPLPARPYLLTDPVAMSKLWRVQNAKTLLLADIPPAENTAAILGVCTSVDIPIQVDCSSRTAAGHANYAEFLNCGVYRLILPSSAGRKTFERLAEEYGTRRLGIRVPTNIPAEVVGDYAAAGCCRFIVDTSKGKETADMSRIAGYIRLAPRAHFTVEGAVVDYPTLATLVEAAPAAVDSVVIGAPLHSVAFPCQAMWCWNHLAEIELNCFTTATVISPDAPTGTKIPPQQ